ncbi:hypothetical protein K9U40_02895 [Xanthobacter autotrophicus]|uniref:hypothetical protein n=1 Tax=Xanthobacter TaxID=279 RepID=UPI0024AC0448|nr:hypothetical protein [Xanthobacter autotrophicus]MDI4663292.1 hypothetical protein [Xanthobacter autotrophicus]
MNGIPAAYLVMSMVRSRGSLVLESETVCFDRDLAVAMAMDDCRSCSWSGVYPLDAEGRCVAGSPIFCMGSLSAALRSERDGAYTAERAEAAQSAP